MTPPPRAALNEKRYPIDLPTALRLAGANNLQVALAAERVQAASAREQRARSLWIPSLNGGVIYNNHAGRIQDTQGQVLEVARSSFYVGGGPVVSNSPLTGASGGPARLFVDLSLVDAWFEPLAAQQARQGAQINHIAVFNDTLLRVTSVYLALVGAEQQLHIAMEAVKNSEELAKITADRAEAGLGLEADAQRAGAELNRRRRNLLRAKENLAAVSAELVRLLRLDPTAVLIPREAAPIPFHLIDATVPLESLIAQAQAVRPEAMRADTFVQETDLRKQQEHFRPWLPNLYVGFSGGGFGGSGGSSIDNFSDRTDFDVAAVWKVENLGFGNRGRQREAASVNRQARILAVQVRDRIASEVARTYRQVMYREGQVEVTRRELLAALQALPLNFKGIRGGTLRAIEAQQAISALARARSDYLAAVLDYNQAQAELLRAVGRPLAAEQTGHPSSLHQSSKSHNKITNSINVSTGIHEGRSSNRKTRR